MTKKKNGSLVGNKSNGSWQEPATKWKVFTITILRLQVASHIKKKKKVMVFESLIITIPGINYRVDPTHIWAYCDHKIKHSLQCLQYVDDSYKLGYLLLELWTWKVIHEWHGSPLSPISL